MNLVKHTLWRFRFLLLLVVAGGVGAFLYVSFFRQQSVSAETYTVKAESLQDILALSGFIDAGEVVDLQFQSAGRLAWVGVQEGDRVKKYQGIASLDTRQLQKSIEKYLNAYDRQRRSFDQTEDDRSDDASLGISDEIRQRARRVLESAQFDLNNSVLDVEIQTIAKEFAYLYSPIEGIVTRVDAPQAGMNVSFSHVYQIINPASLYFSLSVDQTDVVRVREGMRGSVTLDAYPDRTIEGVVTRISFTPRQNEAGTVYEVQLEIPIPEDMPYRIGMTGDVTFILDEIPSAIAIPFSYIDEKEDGTPFVLVQSGGKTSSVPVETGAEYDGLVQILSGVGVGDVLVSPE